MHTLEQQAFQPPRWVELIRSLSKLCGVVSASMIAASVMITCQMIWVRFVLNGSTIWQTEAVVYLMISATLIGLPYVQLLRGHVNVDLLPLLLNEKGKKILVLLTLTISILIAAAIAVFGFELAHEAFTRNWRSDTVWGVRLWIPYMALPIGFGILILQLIADFVYVCMNQAVSFGGGH